MGESALYNVEDTNDTVCTCECDTCPCIVYVYVCKLYCICICSYIHAHYIVYVDVCTYKHTLNDWGVCNKPTRNHNRNRKFDCFCNFDHLIKQVKVGSGNQHQSESESESESEWRKYTNKSGMTIMRKSNLTISSNRGKWGQA